MSFIELVSRKQLNLRVFERGVEKPVLAGQQRAAAAYGIKFGKLDTEVIVNQPGGRPEHHLEQPRGRLPCRVHPKKFTKGYSTHDRYFGGVKDQEIS